MTNILGLDVPVGHRPELDPDFVPVYPFLAAYEAAGERAEEIALVVERRSGQTARRDIRIHGTAAHRDLDFLYTSLMVDALLWQAGGPTLYVCGDEAIAARIRALYAPGGERGFDYDFFGRQASGRPMEVLGLPRELAPASTVSALPVHKDARGRRVGIDLGASDIKYAATADGQVLASDELVWHPKRHADPNYHFEWITKAIRLAAAALGDRVDSVSYSSAGMFDGSRVSVSSLFRAVPDATLEHWRDILPRAARAVCGAVPVTVANDGDVSAFAGYLEFGRGEVLGAALGTSLACGYVNRAGGTLGWAGEEGFVAFTNELAFVIGDLCPSAARDADWSGKPCYSQLLSQDAVVRLAGAAGIRFAGDDPAERLKQTQALVASGDERAARVFRSIGAYLAHAVPHFQVIYDGMISSVLLLGRVMSGVGGEIIRDTATGILTDAYPHVAGKVSLVLPGEEFRRKGQAVYACFLH